ncbi:MAG: TIGR04283 family arsenosugar biosynthesis glycosyltransferase [Burkholderiaceae bacterium]
MKAAGAPMTCRLSIVMPVYNEGATLQPALQALAPLRARGVELIVVDGQSRDDTLAVAQGGLADRVVNSLRGRARQMNAGASKAGAEVLLFLHADTTLPPDAAALIDAGLARRGAAWGRFDVRIDGRHPMLRTVAALMNRRSRLTGIATGDQAIFVTREAFDAVRGFPDQPLMEDLELSRSLRRQFGRPVCLKDRVVTSGRRWERDGVWPTIFLMWRLRALYWLGVSPKRLARRYR